MKPPKGATLTFRFFRDPSGRLRARCQELGVTKPVESRSRKRYKFAKVFGFYDWFSSSDLWRLQTAGPDETIKVKVV